MGVFDHSGMGSNYETVMCIHGEILRRSGPTRHQRFVIESCDRARCGLDSVTFSGSTILNEKWVRKAVGVEEVDIGEAPHPWAEQYDPSVMVEQPETPEFEDFDKLVSRWNNAVCDREREERRFNSAKFKEKKALRLVSEHPSAPHKAGERVIVVLPMEGVHGKWAFIVAPGGQIEKMFVHRNENYR